MAWTYALSAECGPDRESAERLRLHFEQAEWTLSSGVRTRYVNGIHMDQFGNWWANICPSGVSRSGVTDVETAKQLSEVGGLLYELLRTASDFRYAVVGVESDEFMFFHNIGEDLVTNPISGLVISNPIWEKLRRPDVFVSFSSGYRWIPYEGEVCRAGALDHI